MYDAFLNLLGSGIKGESQKKDHNLEIDLIAFSWGTMNSTKVGTGTGPSLGKVRVQDFNVLKNIDASSPQIFRRSCDGSVLPQVEVTLQKQQNSDDKIPYLHLVFTNAYITSFQWNGSNGTSNDTPLEAISFVFEKCQVEYLTQQDDGTPGEPIATDWDVSADAPA
jgi:type VI secretion system secreted protein Hcp